MQPIMPKIPSSKLGEDSASPKKSTYVRRKFLNTLENNLIKERIEEERNDEISRQIEKENNNKINTEEPESLNSNQENNSIIKSKPN